VVLDRPWIRIVPGAGRYDRHPRRSCRKERSEQNREPHVETQLVISGGPGVLLYPARVGCGYMRLHPCLRLQGMTPANLLTRPRAHCFHIGDSILNSLLGPSCSLVFYPPISVAILEWFCLHDSVPCTSDTTSIKWCQSTVTSLCIPLVGSLKKRELYRRLLCEMIGVIFIHRTSSSPLSSHRHHASMEQHTFPSSSLHLPVVVSTRLGRFSYST
jgi:hypothetical protein